MDNSPRDMQDAALLEQLRENIAAHIEARGETVRTTAEKAGIGRDRLYKFLNKRSQTISTEVVVRLADHFDVPFHDLFNRQAREASHIARRIEELPPEERAFLLRQIEGLVALGGAK